MTLVTFLTLSTISCSVEMPPPKAPLKDAPRSEEVQRPRLPPAVEAHLNDKTAEDTPTTGTPAALLDRTLRDAGIPLAPKE